MRRMIEMTGHVVNLSLARADAWLENYGGHSS
jgi:hypothetical protein